MYTNYDALDVDAIDDQDYQKFIETLSEEEKELLEGKDHFYQLEFENKGGLPMPIIVEFTYEDGTTEIKRIPAEIWRFGQSTVTKAFITDKKVINITIDPFLETADIDTDNNSLIPQAKPDRFELFKRNNTRRRGGENPMQRAERAKKIEQP